MELLDIVISLLVSWILIQSFFLVSNNFKKSNKLLPPGPTPLPFIGNLHILGQKPHQSLAKLSKIYGPIMSLKLGHTTMVVISSPSTAKQVLKTQDLAFCTRSVPDAVQPHNHSQNSVVWMPVVGSKWRNLRKIMSTAISSTNRLNASHHLRTKKVEELITYCDSSCKDGKAVDIRQATFRTSLNLMSNTIFSQDLPGPFQDSATHLIQSIMEEIGTPNLADFFPILKMIDPQGVRRRSTVYIGKLMEIFGVLINQRLESRKALKSAGDSDLLDICLDICENNPKEIEIPLSKSMFMDLFLGGTDTTSSTVEWGMVELLRHQEIMIKAKMELDQVIGKGKIVKETDISQLPYLQCIMKETLRLHPAGPLLIPRKVESDDVEVNGYVIPKNTQVVVNAWAIGRDPNLWEEPLSFKPERFLVVDRDFRGLDFELIPFGAGHRICPGLPLAMRMTIVMLGSLVNSFEWEIDGGIGAEEMDMSEKFGITLHKEKPLLAIPLKLA